MKPRNLTQLLALLAGTMDFLTGLGLVFLPAFTLRLMGVGEMAQDALPSLRLVGAFVAAVGASYLWALIAPEERLRTVFGVTALVRFSVGSVATLLVINGSLSPAFLSVGATDLTLAAVQVWMMKRERFWR